MLYGLYIGIVLILVSVVYYATGNSFAKSAQYVSYLVMIAGVVFIQINYKKSLGGTMSYGQGLVIALLSMIVAGILAAIYTILLYKVIDPSLIDQMRAFTEEQMLKKGISEEQMEAAMAVASKFQKPVFMAVMSIVTYAFLGLIIGLIASIFTQKKPAEIVE